MASPFRLQLTVSLVALVVAMASSAMGIGVLKSTYNASTELDGSAATLHWTLSPSTIQLALVVKAPSVVTTNASALWVGFGIGDPQSGGMVGADIVTAEYGSAAADGANCEIVDRHVPMVAYPLGSGVGGEAIFPVPDDCPTKQSWVLIACSVDPTTGMMTLEASRSLAAPNPAQDRDIVAGRNILMYAYGDGFAYHGAARRSVEVDLTASGVSAALAGDLVSTGALPPDADDSILLTMPNYTVSTNRTDYACATFELDPPAPGTVQQMVAAEAVIDLATSGGRLVHHLVVLSCDQSPEFESFKTGKECLTMLPVCTEQVFGWAVGAKPLVIPDEAGFPITMERRFFLLQVHYDNPEALPAVVDSSSVRLHTTSQARKYDSGVIGLGNLGIFMGDERVMSKNYTYTCPSECTSQMAGPVTVFYSALHAHYTATTMWTNLYRNGSFFRTVEAVKHWSNEHQRPTLFEPFTLLPGDRLTVSAEYNVDKIVASGEAAPAWGLGTHEEMLLTGLFVYPRPTRVGPNTTDGDTISACGGAFIPTLGEQWTLCAGRKAADANASAAVEGVDFFNRSARAVADEAGWADPFNEAPACLANTGGGGGDAGGGSGGGGGECFPAAATVLRRRRHAGAADLEAVRMDALALGDEVLGADGVVSPVYLFSHADAGARAPFVRVTAVATGGPPRGCAASGTCAARRHTLLISAGHLLPTVRGGGRGATPALTPAASLAPGMVLTSADGSPVTVTAVDSTVRATGLYHPHTLSGTLVVDGIVASDRTTAVPAAVAAVATAPLRAAYVAGWTAPAAAVSRWLTAGCPTAVRAVAAAVTAISF